MTPRGRRDERTGRPGRTAPPPGVDLTRPSIARVYDYVLGGKDHYAIDRQVSEALFAVVPEATQVTLDSRKFLQRAVRYLVAEAGIRQFSEYANDWSPDDQTPTDSPVHTLYAGGVGRKPGP